MAGASDGYVLLVHRDQPLGCGLLRGDSIRNMLPKAKRLELKFI
jgi:NOL1/NOP2/fmu family ribosome biogenesis protein